MALKRHLSQPSAGATPARKAPRLALDIDIPSSPHTGSTAATVVASPSDDRARSPPRSSDNLSPLPVRALMHLDPAQLVARLEDLAEEYERSVDEMGEEVHKLRRQVSIARRQLESTPSFEGVHVKARPASNASLERQDNAAIDVVGNAQPDADTQSHSNGVDQRRGVENIADRESRDMPGRTRAESPGHTQATAIKALT